MTYKIWFKVFEFYEIGFLRELIVESLITKVIGFTSLKIVRFDPFKVELKDITISIIHATFFSKANIMIKG
jgi:hypothetical protein